MKASRYFILCALLSAVVFGACNGTSSMVPPSNGDAGAGTAAISTPAVLPVNRVEVVYFHMPQRCSTCLCFEERVSFVVNTYFPEEVASGKLTFTVCEHGDIKKAELIRRYNAFSTQLFINTVQNNADNIKYIEEIWSWLCVADEQGFDAKVRTLIEQALEDVG